MNNIKSQLNSARAELDILLEKRISERTERELEVISALQTRIRNLNNQIGFKK